MAAALPIFAAIAIAGAVTTSQASSSTASSSAEEEGTTFLKLPSLTVSVIRDSRVKAFLNVSVELETGTLEARSRARKLRPRLSNDYYRVMTRFAAGEVSVGKVINLARLERLLQIATDRVLGKGEARLLVSNAMVRRP